MSNLENNLINPTAREDFLALLKEKIYRGDIRENLLLVREIDRDLDQLSPSAKAIFSAEFSELYYLLKWRALPSLRSEQVLDLVSNHLAVVRKLSLIDEPIIDLAEAIRGFMVTVIDFEERDQLKIAFRGCLLNNKEIISPSLKLKTIGDWLKDVSSKADPYLKDALKKNEYYISDQNFKSLAKLEQDLLKSIFSLYNYCFYSSQSVEGLDELLTVVDDQDGKIKILNRGVLEDTGLISMSSDEEEYNEEEPLAEETTIKSNTQATDLTNLYQQTLNSIIAKYKIVENLSLWENKTPLELINALETSSRGEIILPALVTLIKNNKDLAILTTNTALQRSLALANGDLTGILKALFTRAGLNDQEGIVMAIRLSQDNKSLSGLAYGDLKSGAFHWR